MKKSGLFLVCGLISVFLLVGIAAAKERVVVYTSLENEEIVEYLKVAKKELADLDIQAIRLSTGELGARMLAEKDNPQADCIWGWAVTNMSEFVPKGMLATYKPRGWDKIPANFKDPKGYWTAIDLYAAALVPNTKVLAQKNMRADHAEPGQLRHRVFAGGQPAGPAGPGLQEQARRTEQSLGISQSTGQKHGPVHQKRFQTGQADRCRRICGGRFFCFCLFFIEKERLSGCAGHAARGCRI
jgi:hypothetical protein